MYSVSSYYTAKVMMETPILIVIPLLYTLIIYFGIGLTVNVENFFYFFFILTLVVFSSAPFGYLLSSLFSEMETAVTIAPLIMLPIVMFGGLFTNVDSYPGWITWI